MNILRLTWLSLLNRRFTSTLTIISIGLSVTMLLGVERLRLEARNSFANTISGTDLIVGARSGSIQLLLYSVFRIGNATNNISWTSYQFINKNKKVAWSVPISLGDSHRGFRVMGTNLDYFKHYRFANKRNLEIEKGRVFSSTYDAVIGADVATELNYDIGHQLILAHGLEDVGFSRHKDNPFRVVGILKKTGTPVDRTIHVRLSGIEAIHADWKLDIGVKNFTPKNITAALIGLKSKMATFQVQRAINTYSNEPLLAILPGATLQELWDTMGMAEIVLIAISGFVVIVGLTGMLTAVLTSLNERRREMAILRSLGARPGHIFSLVMGETLFLTCTGILFGVTVLYLLLVFGQSWIEYNFGLFINISGLTLVEISILGIIICAGLIVGTVPAYRAYRNSLADGMMIRI